MSSDLLLLSFNLGSLRYSERAKIESIECGHRLGKGRTDRGKSSGQSFVVGRILLRYGLRDFIGSNEFEVAIGEYGRPFLQGYPSIDFNITHSGDWIMCFLGKNRRVGVDVELTRSIYDDVLERFSVAEVERIRGRRGRSRNEAFYQTWTAKEAFLKADGRTFLLPLDQFSVDFPAGEPTLRFRSGRPQIHWNLSVGKLDRRHPYAICYSGVRSGCTPAQVTARELADLF